MRKHSYSKTFKAILLSLAPTLVNVRVRRDVRVLNLFARRFSVHVVQFFLQWGKDPIVVVKREEGAWQKINANNESVAPK